MAMFGTVLRGLRSRALLSAGSVLLTALAIGSAVLAPIFQLAVTNSYLVTRLDEAPNKLTALTWRFSPDRQVDGSAEASRLAGAAAARATGPFAAPQTVLESARVDAYGGLTKLGAKPGACDHLEVQGKCPDAVGEVMLLGADLDFTGTEIGDRVDLGALGKVTVVGTYRVPESEADYWVNLERFASTPPHQSRDGTTPYLPAPWITVPEAFDKLPADLWSVLVDRRLEVPPDLELADIDQAERAAATLAGPARPVPGGRLKGDSINDVAGIADEARTQQDTARSSIAPAVISLVLVALALLLRLLMAAADLRLPELALASLRGLGRRQMWSLGLSEPVSLLVLSVPIGGTVGIGLSLTLVRWWLVPGLPLPLPWTALLTGAAVAVAALGVAFLAVGLVLRVSLSEQLTGVRRPRAPGRTALVVQLVLVATAAAILASKLSSARPGDPDVTDLVLPVLLAVVAGVAATRLTAGVATWWTRTRARTRSLPGFVAARAISRRQEGTLVILPVTAAIAICVFGAGVYDSAGQWRASVAATAAPAPVVWSSPLPMASTVDLTHRLDPDGQWLMAASTMATQGPSYTVMDTTRLSRVASWPDQWTPGVSTDEIAAALGVQAVVPTLTGTRVGLTVDRTDLESGDDIVVRLRLNAPNDRIRYVFLGPFSPGTTSIEGAMSFCRVGCQLEGITIGGPAATTTPLKGVVRISGIAVDGRPVSGAISGAGWSRAQDASAGAAIARVEAEGEELVVTLDSEGTPIIAQLSAGAIPDALPVVRGVDAETVARGGASTDIESNFPVDSVFTARSVPLLGPIGLLIDYTMLATDRTLYEQNLPVYVLARADTPTSVTNGLRDNGITVDTTLAEVENTLDQSAYALALRLYAVVAVLVLLMALAGLFVSTAVQLPSRRRDAASLRVVGVSRRAVMSAVVREFAVVLGGTAVAGLAAGTLAQYVVLRTVTLGYVQDLTTPALIAAVDWGRLAVLSAITAAVFGVVALASAALTVRGARGATLRENAR
ncbi:FtsX-like permease family protein [Nocardioides sp.]|uniref:FtsX-like permease family protein n=1 Tax=Nocardioides sp. TaxID=35761 RepID=UPI0031FF42E3|nr:FtsX-like permease family protein [Nocardioides sp.]